MVFSIVLIDIRESEKVIYLSLFCEKYQPYTKMYSKTLDKAAHYMTKILTPSGCNKIIINMIS